MGIPKDRSRQFGHLQQAESALFAWVGQKRIPLHKVEFVVPFVDTDFRAHVLLLLKTDQQVRELGANQKHEIEGVFKAALRNVGYPEEHQALITFEYDSDETVQRDFQGSYFYRLR